jgi:hypothetical protein
MPRNTRARRPLVTTALAVTGAAVALVAATVLTGFGEPSAGSERAAGERASPVRTGGTPGSVTEHDRLLHDAEQRLLRDCMRRHGFTYRVFPLDEEPGAEAFAYVLDSAAWARQHGYGSELHRERTALARSDPNRAYFAALPADRKGKALVAANGPSPDGLRVSLPGGGTVQRSDRGCVAESQQRLYGDVGAWFRASTRVDALRQIRRSRVVADSDYVEALGEWRLCMRRAGHTFATPAAARASAFGAAHPLGKDQEVALALAEVRCGEESGLARTARRLDDHHRNLLAREYRADVEARDRLRAAALPRARLLLGDDAKE